MSLNANEEMLAGNADADASYPDVDPRLLNINAGYADADTDLCIRIMFLYCNKVGINWTKTSKKQNNIQLIKSEFTSCQ